MPTTNYIWDEDNLLAEADGTNTIQTLHTNEPEQYGNLLSSRISGTTSYYHFDAIGSTRQLTNAVETVTDSVIYDAWGSVVNRTGATDAGRLWVGEVGCYYDIETGLFSISGRPYGAAIGRWTTIDPSALVARADLYIYAFNAPVAWIDPSGNDAIILSPKKPDSMPWWEKNLGNKFPGYTDVMSADVQCVCDCCEDKFTSDCKTHKREINCTVRVWLQLQINSPVARKEKPAGGAPGGVEGVYGHEQRHVKVFIKAAEDANKKLKELIEDRGCITPDVCRTLAKDFAEQAQKVLDAAKKVGHDTSKGGPARGSVEKPIGSMPKTADDKAPGAVPEFAKEKKCKDEDE